MLHCGGADAAQFILFERASFVVLDPDAARDAAIADQFVATTPSHILWSSPLEQFMDFQKINVCFSTFDIMEVGRSLNHDYQVGIQILMQSMLDFAIEY